MTRFRKSRTMPCNRPNQPDQKPANAEYEHRWYAKQFDSSSSHVPARPGLYVIGHIQTYRGLEVAREYVYVGKTDNLRRRLREHLPPNEQNSGLRNYLRELTTDARCWYTVFDAADSAKLNSAERALITRINPRFNIVGKQITKKEGTHNE